MVKAYNRFLLKEEAATTKPCPFCLAEVPLRALGTRGIERFLADIAGSPRP